ncbi:hypothetical protein HC928_07035 [bacterium]|nr:hypothetical protein [bacterium]
MSAAELTQTARTSENWTLVADKWQRAIALLQSIPPSDPTYPQAQQKITEYGNNLAYAQQALNNSGKP